MKTITLIDIEKLQPPKSVWKKLLKSLGKNKSDDTPLTLEYILELNNLDDTLWCLRCWPEYDAEWRFLAASYADLIKDLMKDESSIKIINIAVAYVNGRATKKELEIAYEDAHFAYAIAYANYVDRAETDVAVYAAAAAADVAYSVASEAVEGVADSVILAYSAATKVIFFAGVDDDIGTIEDTVDSFKSLMKEMLYNLINDL